MAAVELSLNATAAFATPLTGSYSIAEQYAPSQGGPTITRNLGSAGSFGANLTAGTETTPTNFFFTAVLPSKFSGLPFQTSWKPQFLQPAVISLEV
jgi:hypothetical protein